MDRYQDRFNFSEMISNVYPLDQVNEAIASMERLEEIKPALIPAE